MIAVSVVAGGVAAEVSVGVGVDTGSEGADAASVDAGVLEGEVIVAFTVTVDSHADKTSSTGATMTLVSKLCLNIKASLLSIFSIQTGCLDFENSRECWLMLFIENFTQPNVSRIKLCGTSCK
ncbi:hypothetical protein WDW86_15415 [Bdellovibrionota bacterium FG-2]